MKIIRHSARDMRSAMRGIREQLGEEAVILSSRRTDDGIEVTAAIDFDSSNLQNGGVLPAPLPPPVVDAVHTSQTTPAGRQAAAGGSARNSTVLALTAPRVTKSRHFEAALPEPPIVETRSAPSYAELSDEPPAAPATQQAQPAVSYDLLAGDGERVAHGDERLAPVQYIYEAEWISAAAREAVVEHLAAQRAPMLTAAATAAPAPIVAEPRFAENPTRAAATLQSPATAAPTINRISAEPRATTAAPVVALTPAAAKVAAAKIAAATARAGNASSTQSAVAPRPTTAAAPASNQADGGPADHSPIEQAAAKRGPTERAPAERAPVERRPVVRPALPTFEAVVGDDPVEQLREATLTPLAGSDTANTFAEFKTPATSGPEASEDVGNELKTLRRMLETQLAHLAWNDLTRRAPVHCELLRELTEIGISQDLAEHLVRQLPEDTEITFARRFTIAGLSQYLKVTGDRWLDEGGRVAFVGATGVGKTTTLAKIAVRWVLRHGARDIALVAGDSMRIGAQDQLQSLAQLLGVPVYTPERFDQLPALLSRLNERLVLIDTPGSSARDPQLASRLAVLSNSASQLETALVLAASTQAGAIEEAVKHFAPANPACCVLTKLDEAASLGGILSVLIRAGLPVSYMSEGQRVPEDLRPARALELVSAAVRLAKASGAAADEDLLRRRFGKTAHGIS